MFPMRSYGVTMPDLMKMLEREGYKNIKVLDTKEVAATMPFIFTHAIVVGLGHGGYRTRFCYERETDAVKALAEWDGEGWPPGYWIKEK